MRIFLAGIMQGSHYGPVMHHQGYRSELTALLKQHWPTAEVYDPLADHGESLAYSDDQGRNVFLHHNRMCGECDLLLAFVPEASMGTAIEMWEAFRFGRVVIAISPLSLNWTVKYCSDFVFSNLQDFTEELTSGRLARRVAEIMTAKSQQANRCPPSTP
jgi:hypothetical protein